jgi:hypothetical protein
MARGIYTSDFVYEIDDSPSAGNVATVISSMLIRMDKWNIGTTETKIKKSNTTTPAIPAHVSLGLNENEFGIHPRYLYCRLDLSSVSSACNGNSLRRFVMIPVLTLAQFNAFNENKPGQTTTPPKSSIIVNHSWDGTGSATYKIMKKVAQRLL